MPADDKGSISPQMLVGVFITVLGALLLLDNLNLFDVSTILRFWPAAIVALGMLVFVQATNVSGQISGGALTLFGTFLLLSRLNVIHVDFWQLFWPCVLILVGTHLMTQTFRLGAPAENQSDVIAGVDLSGGNSPVAPILIDLAQRDTINKSSRFAESALARLAGATDILARSPHRSASLAILVAPDVPAVLIELGYLSNRADAAQMNTEAWRARVATAIAAAVGSHLGGGSGAVAATPGSARSR